MGFYAREVNFYRSLSATVDVRVPRCLHADIADDGAPFVLLLEEITDARTIDQIVGASYDDATRAIDVAVRLHAAFWSNDALAALEWLPPMNTPLNHLAGDLAVQKEPAFVAYWDGQLPAGSIEFVEALTPHYRDLLDWWVDQGHATYAHTDFRADNLLFGGSAGDDAVTLLDWQLSTKGVGVWDVANFLAGSVTTEDRRAVGGRPRPPVPRRPRHRRRRGVRLGALLARLPLLDRPAGVVDAAHGRLRPRQRAGPPAARRHHAAVPRRCP